jgi:hypothetical protein
MSDSCVYFGKLLDSLFVYLFLYVNDLLISSKNIFEIEVLASYICHKKSILRRYFSV